jgi:hypothetical protein
VAAVLYILHLRLSQRKGLSCQPGLSPSWVAFKLTAAITLTASPVLRKSENHPLGPSQFEGSAKSRSSPPQSQ